MRDRADFRAVFERPDVEILLIAKFVAFIAIETPCATLRRPLFSAAMSDDGIANRDAPDVEDAVALHVSLVSGKTMRRNPDAARADLIENLLRVREEKQIRIEIGDF